MNPSKNSQSSTATQAVVRFITQWRQEDTPATAVALAKHLIIDGTGVMLAGSAAPVSDVVRDFVTRCAETGEASVVGQSLKCRTSSAALLNGVAGHALDFDDTQLSSAPDRIFGLLTHPTIPALASSLAVGSKLGISGADLIDAYLVGFEVECKIAEAINSAHYKKGFHSSGTIGTFAAVASAARLMKLDPGQCAHAIAIAASMASGIRVNFGTMTKPLHVGRAVQNGIVAAELAAGGLTGGHDALDGPWGFLRVFGMGLDPDLDAITHVFGKPLSIETPGVSIKPYPCGVLGHPSMDAMLKVVIDHDIKPAEVVAIRLRAGSNILNPLRYPFAHNELEAKFCPAFMLSSIVLRRKAGIHEFSDAFVTSEPVQQMMRKVTTIRDQEIEDRGFDRIRSTVEIDLTDGRILVQQADERYRGGPERPFTRNELYEKFQECAGLVLSGETVDSAFDTLQSLENVPDVRTLIELLTPPAG